MHYISTDDEMKEPTHIKSNIHSKKSLVLFLELEKNTVPEVAVTDFNAFCSLYSTNLFRRTPL